MDSFSSEEIKRFVFKFPFPEGEYKFELNADNFIAAQKKIRENLAKVINILNESIQLEEKKKK